MTLMLTDSSHSDKRHNGGTMWSRVFWGKRGRDDWRRPVLYGYLIIFAFFGLFLGWAKFAPLNSAAIAKGSLVVDSQRKTIQHQEGGTIREILVTEGMKVQKGQTLIVMDRIQADANLQSLESQYFSMVAMQARLIAERDGIKEASQIQFPEDLLAKREDPQIADIIQGEINLFNSHSQVGGGKSDILEQRILEIKKEISALESQKSASEIQLKLIQQEMSSVKELVDQGLERQSRLLGLQRNEASIRGDIGRTAAYMAKSEQTINETRMQMLSNKDTGKSDTTDQLQKLQTNLALVEEKLKAARDVSARVEIKAPNDGVVVGLKFHTVGGVVRSGEPIMDIVPSDDKIVVQAQVKPTDIQSVHVGEKATVRLMGYNMKTTPMLNGIVTNVSADIMASPDPRTEPYYSARIEIDPASFEGFHDLALYPGMPVDTMIVVGERTALQAILGPFGQIFDRAFREE